MTWLRIIPAVVMLVLAAAVWWLWRDGQGLAADLALARTELARAQAVVASEQHAKQLADRATLEADRAAKRLQQTLETARLEVRQHAAPVSCPAAPALRAALRVLDRSRAASGASEPSPGAAALPHGAVAPAR